MTDDAGRLDEVASPLLTPLLQAMDALALAARQMHPARAAELAASVQHFRQPLVDGLAAFATTSAPEDAASLRETCVGAAELILGAFNALEAAQGELATVYRAFRVNTLAQETLYPAVALLPSVSRFFLPSDRQVDTSLIARLADADQDVVGVFHASNEREQRGGYSLYLPGAADPSAEPPLVIALHGGSGHGRDFLWAWLKTARAARAMLLAPTSLRRTWSLNGPDVDSINLVATVETVAMSHSFDRSRVLITGMSDGGTYSTICGVLGMLPVTHVAPVASTFNERLLDLAPAGRLDGLPFYLVHGTLDWVIPVDIARGARELLAARGASVVYREIPDLGHAYPREENARILQWFLEGESTGASE